MQNYICKGSEYTFSKGYIMLPVEIGNIPDKIIVEGEELQRKSTFHVSLLCVKNILEGHPASDLEAKIIELFCNFVAGNDLAFIKYTGEFRLAKFEDRKTMIARCEVSNLDKLFKYLSDNLGFEIPTQPTHVTLYTLQPDIGIGLNSEAELEAKSIIVDVPSEVKSGLIWQKIVIMYNIKWE